MITRLLLGCLLPGLLCAAACESAPARSASGPRVAFLLSTLQEERYKKDQQYFEEIAAERGLQAFTLSADNDNARQLAQVEEALSRGTDVLVIQPTDSAAAANYVPRAHAQGAVVVAYDRSIPGADSSVAHDSYSIGCMQAEAALEATGGRGNFVLLHGQSGHSVAEQIQLGYRDTLRPYIAGGAVRVVMERHHDAWSPEQARQTVEAAVRSTGGEIHAILAHNSGMARGAVQGIQAAGLAEREMFIAGADADAANVNYLCQQKQSVEVLKDIRPLATQAAIVAARLAAPGGGEWPAQTVPVVLVTPDNVQKTMIDTGFHAPGELPSCNP